MFRNTHKPGEAVSPDKNLEENFPGPGPKLIPLCGGYMRTARGAVA